MGHLFGVQHLAFLLLIVTVLTVQFAGTLPLEKRSIHSPGICRQEHYDIFFAVDGSWASQKADFDKVKEFLAAFVNATDVSPSASHVGMLQFSQQNMAALEITFGSSQKKQDILETINDLVYQDGSATFTGQALEAIEAWIFTETGADRPHVKDLLILITYGPAYDPWVAETKARELKKRGVQIIAIGVGSAIESFKGELVKIASGPEEVLTTNFGNLPKISEDLVGKLCQKKTHPSTATNVVDATTLEPAISEQNEDSAMRYRAKSASVVETKKPSATLPLPDEFRATVNQAIETNTAPMAAKRKSVATTSETTAETTTSPKLPRTTNIRAIRTTAETTTTIPTTVPTTIMTTKTMTSPTMGYRAKWTSSVRTTKPSTTLPSPGKFTATVKRIKTNSAPTTMQTAAKTKSATTTGKTTTEITTSPTTLPRTTNIITVRTTTETTTTVLTTVSTSAKNTAAAPTTAPTTSETAATAPTTSITTPNTMISPTADKTTMTTTDATTAPTTASMKTDKKITSTSTKGIDARTKEPMTTKTTTNPTTVSTTTKATTVQAAMSIISEAPKASTATRLPIVQRTIQAIDEIKTIPTIIPTTAKSSEKPKTLSKAATTKKPLLIPKNTKTTMAFTTLTTIAETSKPPNTEPISAAIATTFGTTLTSAETSSSEKIMSTISEIKKNPIKISRYSTPGTVSTTIPSSTAKIRTDGKTFSTIESVAADPTRSTSKSQLETLLAGCSQRTRNIFLAIDGTASVGEINFTRVLRFLQRFVSFLDLGFHKIRVGLLVFGDEDKTKIQFAFESSQNQNNLLGKIRDLPYHKSSTRFVGAALRQIEQSVFRDTGGSRRYAVDLLIVLMSGRTQDGAIASEYSEKLKVKGVRIIAVAIGAHAENFMDQIELMASSPDDMWTVSFQDLDQISHVLMRIICEASRTSQSLPVSSKGKSFEARLFRATKSLPTAESPETTTYPPTTIFLPTSTSTTRQICLSQTSRDILFMVESTNKISRRIFTKVKEFVGYAMRRTLSRDNTYFTGVMQFGNKGKFRKIMKLSRGENNRNSKKVLAKMLPRRGFKRFTGEALVEASKMFYKVNTAHKRYDSQDVIILITYGPAEDYVLVRQEVDLLKARNIKLIIIGIGKMQQQIEHQWNTIVNASYVFSSNLDSRTLLFEDIWKPVCSEQYYRKNYPPRSFGCATGPRDLFFVVDGSASVKYFNFDNIRKLLQDLIVLFHRKNNDLNIGIMQFSETEKTNIALKLSNHSINTMLNVVQSMTYHAGSKTDTGNALSRVSTEVFNRYEGDRPFADDIIILITDGKAHDIKLARLMAELMKARRIKIVCIAVGPRSKVKKFRAELKGMASKKQDVITVDFPDLATFATKLLRVSC